MDILTIINNAFQILVPLAIMLGVTSLSLFLSTKKKEAKAKTDSEVAHKYLDMLEDTIMKSVIATTQTYVDELKGKNVFDAEAQKTAFAKTYNAVINTLTEEATLYLNTLVGDLETYITTRIEYNVSVNK